MNYDIITIGAATRDAFLISKAFQNVTSDRFETGTGECVALGSKIELNGLTLSTGGGATNAAATFGDLGFKTAVIARVGNDTAAIDVQADLKKHHVSTELLRMVKGDQTAYSTLLVEANGGERTALVYRGASASFTEADLPWNKMKSDWLYLTSLAGNLALIKKLVAKLGTTTKICWNPGSAELNHGLKAFTPLFKHLFLLIMNAEEAKVLFGETNPLDVIPETLTLVITDGNKGATATVAGQSWFVAPSKAKVISRTGAGDAFGSGLVAGLMNGMGLDDALRVGLLNAQGVIQQFGAKEGILKKWPTAKELKQISVRAL